MSYLDFFFIISKIIHESCALMYGVYEVEESQGILKF